MSAAFRGQCEAINQRPFRTISALVLITLLFGACAPQRPSVAPTASITTSAPAAHAAQIRFGLIGSVTQANVWALFDNQGYSYSNYAVRAGYWPRLYALSIPERQFTPAAADGMPTGTHAEGIFQTASVQLRKDLRWSDGRPLTAMDVAFTVNTALKFQLGFDWAAYYDAAWLDHAEAVNPETVKYFFKRAPSVAEWQYGALQGPMVEEAFWATKVATAAESLPSDDLLAKIDGLEGKIDSFQQEVNRLYLLLLSAQGEQARELQADLRRQQGNLDEATNDLAAAQTEVLAALDAARAALYNLPDEAEPHLGSWLPDEQAASVPQALINVANASYPGSDPHFDRAVYITYESRDDAETALQAGDIDVILDPASRPTDTASSQMASPTRAASFLVFNPKGDRTKDVALRNAMACLVDQAELAGLLGEGTAPLASFIPAAEDGWYDRKAQLPCAGMDAATRLLKAAEILRAAGYTWQREPSGTKPGQELRRPDGESLPSMILLVSESDARRRAAATYLEKQGHSLGLPLSVKAVGPDAVDYAVLSSHDYDLAILGWRTSPYPGYLCDWFGSGGAFESDTSRMTPMCADLETTGDLDQARDLVHQIQQDLAAETPMLPLYTGVVFDSYRNVSYPFEAVQDGLAGVYGAPGLAIPTAP